MGRELTHHLRPEDPAVVDFFYGTRRIAELRWSANEQDRATCEMNWYLAVIHFTGEDDSEAGVTACGDLERQSELVFSPDHGPAWQRLAEQVREETRGQAIDKANAELKDRIEYDTERGLEPFPELNHIP